MKNFGGRTSVRLATDNCVLFQPAPNHPAGPEDDLESVAGTTQLALAAGVLDEIEFRVIPVLSGRGRRLFEGLAPEHIELERTRILEGESGVTHMHYRVKR